MAYQGEYFVERYGAEAAEATPPIARMLATGVPVSAGTDATRVASYNPWVSLAWLVTGRTVGGLQLYPQRNCLDRETALRLWTEKVSLVLQRGGQEGPASRSGQLADLIVPDRDYFACPRTRSPTPRSLLTVRRRQGGLRRRRLRARTTRPPPPAMPDWSPVRRFGGYGAWAQCRRRAAAGAAAACGHGLRLRQPLRGARPPPRRGPAGSRLPVQDRTSFWGALGCACWAV